MTSRLAHSLLVALMLACAPAWADIGRDEAAAAARQAAGGRVLAVDKAQVGNRAAWRVKLVTAGGEVKVVLIDAATGKPL
ncbi:MAG: PepSY domain-containing protein [Burkholderiaceae bacterium]|nr:PepSY domain-containing protein [Burkholderiaceae bacterium]